MNRRFLTSVLLAVLLPACDTADDNMKPGQERTQANEAAITARMIALISEHMPRSSQGDLQRFNQAKSLACLDARFQVDANLPSAFQHGLLQPGARYATTVRFANAVTQDDRDKDFRGASLKLHGTPGTPLWGEPGTTDFLFNSYPVLFAANPEDFLDFIEASANDQRWRYFLNPAHWYSLAIVLRGREQIDSPFDIPYFSTTPYRLGGEDSAVKYALLPCGDQPHFRGDDHPDALTQAIARQLETGDACFRFAVQPQGDPADMPIENASQEWDTDQSAWQAVATVNFHSQTVAAAGQDPQCEQLRFNPWQATEEHRPLGGINRVRRAVYAEAGQFRIDSNREHSNAQE